MSLSPIKQQILETLLLHDKPLKAREIAVEIQKEVRLINMHLLGLIQMGYASTPEKGNYIITEKGKEAIGIPQISKEKAIALLAYAPHDEAFHFYVAMEKPLNIHAHNLRDFANKITKVDLQSIEFHVKRGDFEAWINGIGDIELAKKISLLKQKNIVGENLRKQLHEIVEQRYIQLAAIAGQTTPS